MQKSLIYVACGVSRMTGLIFLREVVRLLSRRLIELLDENKMTKENLAEKCGLPIETIRNIYYGKTTDPKVSTLFKIANALNVSIECLISCEIENPLRDNKKILDGIMTYDDYSVLYSKGFDDARR